MDLAAAHNAAALLLAAARVDPTLRAAAERVQDALLALDYPARDHADAELRHRDDLARDVARLWRTEDTRPGGPSDALSAALDRLARAVERVDAPAAGR